MFFHAIKLGYLQKVIIEATGLDQELDLHRENVLPPVLPPVLLLLPVLPSLIPPFLFCFISRMSLLSAVSLL